MPTVDDPRDRDRYVALRGPTGRSFLTPAQARSVATKLEEAAETVASNRGGAT